MEEEIERTIDRVAALERSADFWDRRVFRRAMRNYGNLRSRINNLNILINGFNLKRELPDFDPNGEIYSRIREDKRKLFEEAREICISIRRGIVDREMEKRYGDRFIDKVKRYEEDADNFHKYLVQEASGKGMPESGMVRASRLKKERGY